MSATSAATSPPSVPRRLTALEPLASLALAGHAVAVEAVAGARWLPVIGASALILTVLGVAGLLGMQSTAAVATRGLTALGLGFVLQAVKADSSGYFLLWFFVLVAVYPLVLPPRLGGLVPFATPAAYLALVPLDAVDGPVGVALLRAVSLTVMGIFVHRAASLYRDVAGDLAQSEARAQEALTTLQRSLLPAVITSRPGMRVAARYRAAGSDARIGGDWYDTIDLPWGGTALVIGDVEGHDLIAASTMGLVRGAVRSYALEGHPPAIVLERVQAFLESTRIERLVTVAYVQLYPDATVATVALGGHPAPVVLPAGAPAYVIDCSPGPILGVPGLGDWAERTVQIPPGATLVLHTDGLVDAHGPSTGHVARLVAATAEVSGGTSVEDVAELLIGIASGHDDAAVLVAQVSASTAGVPARRTLPAQPVNAGVARTWLADLFALWRSDGTIAAGEPAAERLEVAQLLLTELFSNAVRHSDRSVVVCAEVRDGRLHVEVADTSERMPVMRRPEAAATEGRGLRLVDTLSHEWGVRLDEHGKSVWFSMDLVVEQIDPARLELLAEGE